MSEPARLFRAAAVEAAAGETLFDDALRIIRPRLWIAAVSLAALVVTAIGWSAIFRIPITVAGRGILLAAGGVADVSADGGGAVRAVLVEPGDRVAAGQIIAALEQPDVRLKLAVAEGELADARRLLSTIGAIQGRDSSASEAFRRARATSLTEKIEALTAQRKSLAERQTVMRSLADRGLITRERLLDAEISVVNIDGQIADARDERAQMASQAETREADREREQIETLRRVGEAERNVSALREQLARTGAIRTPFSGRVVEVKANVGQSVQAGTPMVTVERTAAGGRQSAMPIAVVYVSTADGKKLKPGMRAEISPSTSRREEDGYLIGRIEHIGASPASSAGMIRRLQNDQLVQSFVQSVGAPFEVMVVLEPDPAHPGQPLWSSDRPGRAGISSGALMDARFTVRRTRLLALAIPALQDRPGGAEAQR